MCPSSISKRGRKCSDCNINTMPPPADSKGVMGSRPRRSEVSPNHSWESELFVLPVQSQTSSFPKATSSN